MSAKLIRPSRIADKRGWFSETYRRDTLEALGVNVAFCQDNHSLSRARGVLRGFHFQRPPHAQAKLVRCVRGGIWDVAIDLRAGSPTYGQWVSAELTAENGLQLFIPLGFAHGLITLEADTEVEYKVSDYYAPDCEGGLAWDDPDLRVPWPAPTSGPIVSEKDRALPRFADFESPFEYVGQPLARLGL